MVFEISVHGFKNFSIVQGLPHGEGAFLKGHDEFREFPGVYILSELALFFCAVEMNFGLLHPILEHGRGALLNGGVRGGKLLGEIVERAAEGSQFVIPRVKSGLEAFEHSLKRIFGALKGSDPSIHNSRANDFLNDGVSHIVFRREVVKERADGDSCLRRQITHPNPVKAVAVNLKKSRIEDLGPGFFRIPSFLLCHKVQYTFYLQHIK